MTIPMTGTPLATTEYPFLREALNDRFSELSDTDIESTFESVFGEGVTPAEYEEFFKSLGRGLSRFASQAAPYVASAGSGALQGAMAGSALGPWGALGGAIAGGTGSVLSRHGRGAARDVGGAIGAGIGAAGMLTGRGGAAGGVLGSLGGRGGGAAGQLLGVLRRPETAQALAGLVRGRNPSVPVGRNGAQVPANAFASLLRALGMEAESEALALTGGEAEDVPADPNQQAAGLLQLLAAAARAEAESDESDQYEQSDEYDESDELFGFTEIAEFDEFGVYEYDEFDEVEESDLEFVR